MCQKQQLDSVVMWELIGQSLVVAMVTQQMFGKYQQKTTSYLARELFKEDITVIEWVTRTHNIFPVDPMHLILVPTGRSY